MITNYYDVLGLDPKSSKKEIKQAHLQLTLILKNQIAFEGKCVTNVQNKVDEAYKNLLDENTRAFHDDRVLNFDKKWNEMTKQLHLIESEREEFSRKIQQKLEELSKKEEENKALIQENIEIKRLSNLKKIDNRFFLSIRKRWTIIFLVSLLVIIASFLIYVYHN